MALNSEPWETDYAEQEARWIELGRLGMGRALQDRYGVHPDKASRMLQLVHKKEDDREMKLTRSLDRILGIQNGLGVVLATLGRDSDVIDLVRITMWELRLHIGNRTTILQPLKLQENDLFALLVNLASSPKIKNVALYVQSQTLCTPLNCAALEKAIASNTTLKELEIHHSSKLQSQMLSATNSNNSLYGQYHDKPLTVPALNRLVLGLRKNTTLETLEITTFPEDLDWVAKIIVACMAATLQEELGIIYVPESDAAAARADKEADLPTSSRIKRAQKSFEFRTAAEPSESTWTRLLAPFVRDGQSGREWCTTISRLSFDNFPSSGVGPLCSVLRTNWNLTSVGLRACQFSTREWAGHIFGALRLNEKVEHLDLSLSLGLTEEDVFDALMSLARFSGSRLKSICLNGTGLENKVGAVGEELRTKTQNRALLKARASILPVGGALRDAGEAVVLTERTSPKAGRIVLCGSSFAGKTSICKTLQQQFHSHEEVLLCGTTQQKSLSPKAGTGLKVLRKRGHGPDSSHSHNGTKDLDILLLTGDDGGPATTTIWDFAAQTKCHVLHDYCYPNGRNSCFFYVCSARHAPDQNGDRSVKSRRSMQEEFRYWLCFIASKSKHVRDQREQITRPRITFVLTGKDSLEADQQIECRKFAKNMVDEFADEFGSVLDISNALEFIDARNEEDVARLFSTARDWLDGLLKQTVLKTEHEACWRIRDGLQRWLDNGKNPAPQPVLTLEQVEELCVDDSLRGQVQSLWEREEPTVSDNRLGENPLREGLKIVLRYLNDAGDIIFVEKLDLVVVSPRWLIAGMVGSLVEGANLQAVGAPNGSSLLSCLSPKTKSSREWTPHADKNGFIRRSTLEELLRGSLEKVAFHGAIFHDSSFIVPSMVHLDLCFEEVPPVGDDLSKGSDPRFCVPVLLGDGGGDGASGKTLKWTVHLPQAQKVCMVGRRLECKNKLLTFLSPGFFPRLQVVLSNYLHEQNLVDTEHFTLSQNFVQFANVAIGIEAIIEFSGTTQSFLDILVRSTNDPERTVDFIRNHVEKQIFEFCGSLKGCPGVTLVEAVIRPVCVEKLFPCENRIHQAILVSTLENLLKQRGTEYSHKWAHPIPGEKDHNLAIDLLQGGSMARLPQLSLGEGASFKRRKSPFEEYPLRIKFTTEDVGLAQKFEAKMNPTKRLPVRLHLLCDGMDSDDPHEVTNQRGRALQLPGSTKGCDIPILRHVVNLGYEALKVAAGIFSVQSVRQIDSFVATLFRTPDINMDYGTLNQIMGQTDAQRDPNHVPSKAELVGMLEEYIRKNPTTEWLRQFLDLGDLSAFQNDFKLQKVKHRDTDEVFWLCDNHFIAGYRNGTYKSTFH